MLFFHGCNLRCPWCHNPELLDFNTFPESQDSLSFMDCISYLEKRRNVIDAVVISGGEPCLNEELPLQIAVLKKMCMSVKLDTNGMFPEMISRLMENSDNCPDYIALDMKLSPSRYMELLPYPDKTNFNPCEKLKQSAALLYNSPVLHEYRTLILPNNMINENDIEELSSLVDDSPWSFRLFKGGKCLDPVLNNIKTNKWAEIEKGELLISKAKSLGKNAFSHFHSP